MRGLVLTILILGVTEAKPRLRSFDSLATLKSLSAILPTPFSPTPMPTTPTTTLGGPISAKCYMAERLCAARCSVGGYTADLHDCTVCTCKPLPTPITPAPLTTLPTPTLGGPISGECYMAERLCSTRCSVGGYMTDPTDCTICMCKSEVPNVGK